MRIQRSDGLKGQDVAGKVKIGAYDSSSSTPVLSRKKAAKWDTIYEVWMWHFANASTFISTTAKIDVIWYSRREEKENMTETWLGEGETTTKAESRRVKKNSCSPSYLYHHFHRACFYRPQHIRCAFPDGFDEKTKQESREHTSRKDSVGISPQRRRCPPMRR